MKTKILLALGAVTLAAFAVSATANDVLLSPRAKDNQLKVVSGATASGTAATPVAVNAVKLSPRAADAQIKTVKNSAPAGNLAAAKCPVIGSPKAVADAGSAARTSCCGMTSGACPDLAACGK